MSLFPLPGQTSSKVSPDEKETAAGGGGDGEKKPDDKKRPGKKKIDNEKPPKESTVVLKIGFHCHCQGCIDKIEEQIFKLEKKNSTIKGFENLTVDGASVLVTVKGTMDAKELALNLEKKLKKTVEVVPPTKNDDGGGEKKDNKEAASGGENKEAGGGEMNKKAKETTPAPVDKGREKDKAVAAGSSRDGAKDENYGYPYPYPQPENYWSSQEQQAQPCPQDAASQSWYPQSVVSPNSSRPLTPGSSYSLQRPTEHPQTPSHVSPGEAAGVIALLKDKSVDELWKLLSDKDAYHQFLLSVDQVKIQNNLAEQNLEKELRIMELRNQCKIIRTTELAAAQEKLNELNRQKEELLKFYSPGSLLQKLQEAMNKTEEESEALHRQLLDKEIDIVSFVQKYKKLRTIYHHLAEKTSSIG
ncbi:hypothetical protein LWI29_026058 [Acer saccharum]|uniref:Uncharacterized protein n=1 Tax=Acer saccharum TaxID=4024 RepID=A0AA39S714_ACESA|nr:hypothetical protein LWI29_026058 [Acer saccharum]